MNGGFKHLLVAASFAAAGCTAAPNGIEIRPLADPGSKLRPGRDRLADARGQLALGNVGLALEGFRKAARDYPNDFEAFAGMAACYEAMRRYDLAQSNYEAALALAPRNSNLLAKLAGTLQQQGKSEAAAQVREEIAQLASASASAAARAEAVSMTASVRQTPAQTVSVALPAPKLVASSAVRLPMVAPAKGASRPMQQVAPPQPAPTVAQLAQPVAPAIPAPRLSDQATVNLLSGLAPRLKRGPGEVVPLTPEFREAAAPAIPAPRVNDQVAVNVFGSLEPRLRRVDVASLLSAPVIETAPRSIATGRSQEWAKADVLKAVPPSIGPRLERMSLGEVALMTAGGPAWRAQVVTRSPQKLAVKWVPLQTASWRPNIRLLNAARREGLAARSRHYLVDRGWRKIEIGNADQIRERSLVLYPAGRPMLGRSLAAQFGCRAQPTDKSDVFIVLLGRDAARFRVVPLKG